VTKRIGVFSDFHVGHKVGLTPPEFFAGKRSWVTKQAARWHWFKNAVREQAPFDCCLLLGDLVDGQGVKNHSECIITDLNNQIDAAVQIIQTIGCDTNYAVFGTPVHVQDKSGLELEMEVAKRVGCKIHGQIWIDIESTGPGCHALKSGGVGYTLDIRHHPAGNSQVYPANPLVKEREANVKWHDEGMQVLANIYFRGHCHRLYDVGQPNRWSAHSVPALQGVGTKYGRRLSNIVHEGFGVLDIIEGMWPIWTVYEAPKWTETPFKL
jgi:hypothetical protein